MAEADSRKIAPLEPYEFVSCPACRGMGMVVIPRFQGQDGLCGYCFGSGKVCTSPCLCGRPRRFSKEGLIVEGLYCCGSPDCKREMQPKVGAPKRIILAERGTIVRSWSDDRDEEDYSQYCC